MDENTSSSEAHEISPQQDHTLPILKKIINLSTKAQTLKREHVSLSDQVKLTFESFPGLDVLKSVQLLGAEYEILKRKYLEESLERRRLNNEVIELKGNIRVFCRCRPLNENEIANGSAVSVVNFESASEELQAVFAQTKPIVASVLDGYNVCIFAYGQTGTGKTFTMEGTPEHHGVNYRTLEELFRISEDRQGTMKYELHVSMLEVYNEKIKDLLAGNPSEATKNASRGMVRGGASSVPCLELAAYLGDEWFVIREGSLHNDAIHCVNILCIAAYGYKDSPMYAQIENCVQLATVADLDLKYWCG
ncbi:kinesin protein KIN-14S [Trifolium repens]|nr:kinesin protein KIN-14S [Trifolium repens]